MTEEERTAVYDDTALERISMEIERDALRYDKAYTEADEVRLS